MDPKAEGESLETPTAPSSAEGSQRKTQMWPWTLSTDRVRTGSADVLLFFVGFSLACEKTHASFALFSRVFLRVFSRVVFACFRVWCQRDKRLCTIPRTILRAMQSFVFCVFSASTDLVGQKD